MYENGSIYMGITKELQPQKVMFDMSQANRHGLIAGASGTGKTITMKVMAESFLMQAFPCLFVMLRVMFPDLPSPAKTMKACRRG